MVPETIVELEGVNGEWFTLAGPNAGDRGVFLGTGVKGLYDPPVKVVWEEPGNYPGSRYLNHRLMRRDIVFGVEILNDPGDGAWISRDSEWRKAWAFDRDCKLYVTTPQYGRRYLKLRLGESPEVDLFNDPTLNGVNRVAMVCVAGDPFWYEDDVIYTVSTTKDTTFDPNALQLPWPWPHEELPSETLWIEIDESDGGVNPTDQIIFPKWTLPGSTIAPAEPYIPGLPWLGAPKSHATIWTVPDYSWQDDEHKNRRLRLPGLIGGLRTNDTQLVTMTGEPEGGTFRLGFKGATTYNLDWDATAEDVRAALAKLPTVGGPANVQVEGGPVYGPLGIIMWWRSPYRISFGGGFSGLDQPDLTVISALTGGKNPMARLSKVADGKTAPAENAVIDTDPRVEQIISESGSQLWSRMNGVRFRHPVPPYTAKGKFEITVSGARAGQMVTLRLPRPWSRPWGLS